MIKSLFGRVFLILIIGMLASMGYTLYAALKEREHSLMQSRETALIDRVDQIVTALNSLSSESRSVYLNLLPRYGTRIELNPDLRHPLPTKTALAEKIAEKLGSKSTIFNLPSIPCPPDNKLQSGNTSSDSICENIAVTLRDGSHFSFIIFPLRNTIPPITKNFFPYLILFFIFSFDF